MSKRTGAIMIISGLVTGMIGLGYYWLFRHPLPRQKGKMTLSGLKGPVEIIHDRWGVPHIYAGSAEDALFAQGYTHAGERLWQMDFNRRLVAGRLSEILGEVTLPLDRWMRTLGMRRAAEEGIELFNEELLSLVNAYTAGVNAYIDGGRLPLEFQLLHYRPEPWSVLDSLSWSKMMAWSLSVNWETELLRAQIIARIGPEKAAELEPLDTGSSPRVIPPEVDYSCIGGDALRAAIEARRFTGPTAMEGIGSNNWVLSASRTSTGSPLLANDMHLPLTIPAIWYENHLCSPDLEVTGVTFPGIPGVVAGHNRQVAWGFTNGFPDVQDLFIEKLRRQEDGRVQYLYQDQWLDAEVRKEEIRVKGANPVTEEVIETRHGPIINSLAPDLAGEQPLAMRWTALEPDRMLQGMIAMNRAGSCQEFREALRNWAVPVQNTVYADTQGNIAYSFPGKVPIRKKGDGRVPVPGWTGEYEWTGYIPFEELPHLFNPPQGYIITANNRVVGDDYPYFLGYDHISSNRALRITELIEAEPTIDINYIRKMHTDQVSVPAREVGEHIARLKTPDPELSKVIERMHGWDGNLVPDSPQAAIYEGLVERLIPSMILGLLGDLAIRYTGKGCTPVLSELSLFGERAREWMRKMLSGPEADWLVTTGMQKDEMLIGTLRETVDFLKKTCGPEFDDWAWGKLHKIEFYHPLGSVKPLDRLFNRGPFPIGGDFDTVWATGNNYFDTNATQIVGPPFRLIADLSNWNNSQGILAPGQSGQPGSPHYADDIKAWMKGETHPMPFDRVAVMSAAVSILTIEPAANANHPS
jgi:penicillin G amidase